MIKLIDIDNMVNKTDCDNKCEVLEQAIELLKLQNDYLGTQPMGWGYDRELFYRTNQFLKKLGYEMY